METVVQYRKVAFL